MSSGSSTNRAAWAARGRIKAEIRYSIAESHPCLALGHEGMWFPCHSCATPCSIPDRHARVDSSRALMSVGRARCPLTRRNLLSARRRPATHHRRRISPSRQRVTRAVTRRVTERADSMGLIGRGQRPTQRPRQAQPDHRQRLLQSFPQARNRIRVDPLQPAGRHLQRRLGGLVARVVVCLRRRRSNSVWCFSGTWALTLRFLWT